MYVWVAVVLFLAACSSPSVEKPKEENNGDDNAVVIISNAGTNGSTNNAVITECGTGRTLCGESCVDTTIDSEHCGRCDNPCGDGTVCSEGGCAPVPTDCRTEGACPARYFCDESTGLCEAGCSSNADCPGGAYCELESHACLCTAEGQVVCGSECVAESPLTCGTSCETCPPIANGAAVCTDGECGQECDDGYMMCEGACAPCPTGDGIVSVACLGDQCVANECEAGYEICEGSCAACPATTGDESLGCDGAECIITDCSPGTKLCNGTCAECPDDPNGTTTCQGESCVLVCSSGYHSCPGEYCAPDGDPNSCGTNCEICPDDPDGAPVCSGGSCELDCFGDRRDCQGGCAECPTGPGVASTMCAGASCVVQSCDPGYEPCTGGCCKPAPDGVAFDYDASVSDVAIAVDSRGYPHIGLGSATFDEIHYIWWDGSAWQNEFVAGGWHVDIELDLMDRPHIAYWKRSPDELWYGVRDPATGWDLEEADRTFNQAGMTPDIELEGNVPHIAHYDLEADNLRYAVKSGGTWTDEIVESSGQVGFSPSLALVSGTPHIVYRDETNDRARSAHVGSQGQWLTSTVYDLEDSGVYPSLAVDSDDDLHLVFEVEPNFTSSDRLLYNTRSNGGFWGMTSSQIADDASRPSLVLDGNDSPIVVYWQPSSSDLRMVSFSNGWTPTDLATAGSVGEENGAAYSSLTGKVHVAYSKRVDQDVMYLSFDP